MGLLDNRYNDTAAGIDNLAYSPDGGRRKLVLYGIVLPALIVTYAVHVWLAERAYLPGHRRSGMDVSGESAQALAITYGFAASFCHFRWFWGLLPRYTVFRIGSALSLVGALAGICATLYFLFR